jgi:hypothetical protein
MDSDSVQFGTEDGVILRNNNSSNNQYNLILTDTTFPASESEQYSKTMDQKSASMTISSTTTKTVKSTNRVQYNLEDMMEF